MESSTYKSKVPGREQRQQFPSPTFSCHILKSSLSKTVFKPTVWKGYIWDDIFSLWDISKPRRHRNFFEQVNFHHPIMKFTAEISDTETIFFPEGGGEQMFIQGGRIPFSKYMPCLPGERFFFLHVPRDWPDASASAPRFRICVFAVRLVKIVSFFFVD